MYFRNSKSLLILAKRILAIIKYFTTEKEMTHIEYSTLSGRLRFCLPLKVHESVPCKIYASVHNHVRYTTLDETEKLKLI